MAKRFILFLVLLSILLPTRRRRQDFWANNLGLCLESLTGIRLGLSKLLAVISLIILSAPASADYWRIGLVPSSYHFDRATTYNESHNAACIGYGSFNACGMEYNSQGRESVYLAWRTPITRSTFWIAGIASGYSGSSMEIRNSGLIPVVGVGIRFGDKKLQPVFIATPKAVFYALEYQY